LAFRDAEVVAPDWAWLADGGVHISPRLAGRVAF
jgi:hypothetical protein